jgi:replicative DNA helicase
VAGLGAGIEEKILTLLVWNTELASSVALDVDPTIFATKHFRLIAKSAIEYIMRYNEAPKNHLPDILEHELSKGDEGKLLWTTIGRMEEINTDVNYEFVLDELNDYIATRRFDKVLENARDLIHKGKRSEAEEMVFSFAGTSADLPGIWSHQPEFTGFMNKDEEDEFHLGIEALDSRGVKPSRKTLFVILAPKKRGKSMCLINIGKEAAFVDHKNVLHITLEMSAAQTAKRYTQAIGGYTAGETLEKNLQIWRFRRDSEGQYSGTECESWPAESLDQQSRVKVSENLAKVSRGKPRLLIKEFPTRSLTSAQLVMFLERLRRREKFVPDLLIVDYANEMYMNAQNIRTETGRIFRDLRGIAVSRNMAVVTATQGNRLSDSAKLVSGIHVAEDWSVMGVADTVVSICRTPEEAQKHLARLYVIAARDVSDQFIVQITQNYEICRFAVDSIYMTKSVQQDLDRLLNDEEDD